jgi:hypothetical protein
LSNEADCLMLALIVKKLICMLEEQTIPGRLVLTDHANGAELQPI